MLINRINKNASLFKETVMLWLQSHNKHGTICELVYCFLQSRILRLHIGYFNSMINRMVIQTVNKLYTEI